MKSIAEQEFPIYNQIQSCYHDADNELRQEGYTLACTHWAEFMEWAVDNWGFQGSDGWYEIGNYHDSPKLTTTEPIGITM
jgi:hypothetical protein